MIMRISPCWNSEGRMHKPAWAIMDTMLDIFPITAPQIHVPPIYRGNVKNSIKWKAHHAGLIWPYNINFKLLEVFWGLYREKGDTQWEP